MKRLFDLALALLTMLALFVFFTIAHGIDTANASSSKPVLSGAAVCGTSGSATQLAGASSLTAFFEPDSGNGHPLFVGGSNVTTANGFAISNSSTVPLGPLHYENLSLTYCVAAKASGKQTLRWFGAVQ